jgi:Fungal specific transcription factor domain
LQDILDSSSEDEDDSTSPGESVHSANRSNDAFIFGYSSLAHSLRNYHPTPTQIFILWKTYEQNVAPLLTIVHKPTIRDIIINAATSLDMLDKNSEALAFSVYLTAVISMTPEQCLAEIGDDRDSVISRFRFATEQAMARANLLTSRNINLLQAAVMFVSGILKQDQSRFVWTLSAVILRLATGLGLHRDGTNFGLSPFETEMRRRLWWHICIMDIRAAEDHGTDPMINEMMYDTKMPLHINDDDISPDSKEFPPERIGFTDMTFTLIRAQVSMVYRNLNYTHPGQNVNPIGFEERKKIIEDWHNMLNEKYVKYCDMQVPIQWSCATVARLLVAKLWLIVHHPFIKDKMSTLSPEDRNRMLLTSIEVIEFTHLLVTSESTQRWGWLFGSYIQWHPIAFVLAELCVRPHCPGVERAWLAVDSVFDAWRDKSASKKASLWRPLTKLYKKAKTFRTKQEADMRRCGFTQPPITSPMELPSRNLNQNSVSSNSPLFADGSQSQFSSPGQSSSPAVSAVFSHPSSTKQNESTVASARDFNFDLNKNMNEILVDFLPAFSMVPNNPTSDASGIYSSNNTTTATTGIPAKVPSTPAFGAMPFEQASWPGETPNAFEMPMNWDQFDDVMRDFQQDFEQVTGQNADNYPMDFL